MWKCYLAPDSQQYTAWNRTRRLRASPYLARTETNTSRRATTLAAATGLTNVPQATNDVGANPSEPPKEKRQETLFGPNIGIISEGPVWTQAQDTKSTSSDYLTPEIVRQWVEASKEVLMLSYHSTTAADLISDRTANHHATGLGQPQTSHA